MIVLVANLISQKQVEEARNRVIELINDTQYFLRIPVKTKYDLKELGEICENWNQASDKLEQAQSIINEIVVQITTQEIPS